MRDWLLSEASIILPETIVAAKNYKKVTACKEVKKEWKMMLEEKAVQKQRHVHENYRF